MAQDTEQSAQPVDDGRRAARANRILDAAAALILRWGYNKTTIDDIARQAGVAKGTIYLHWKSREELFTALIRRERMLISEDVRQRIADDPIGMTLHSLLKYSALALMQRPLLKAVLLRDLEVMGKLAQSEHSTDAYNERLSGFEAYLSLLRDHGMVRNDLSLRAQVYMVGAIFMGFFLVAPLMPEQFSLTDEEIAELLAETVHRALELGNGSADGQQAAQRSVDELFDRDAAMLRSQSREDEDML